jgi:hypothetical protein
MSKFCKKHDVVFDLFCPECLAADNKALRRKLEKLAAEKAAKQEKKER